MRHSEQQTFNLQVPELTQLPAVSAGGGRVRSGRVPPRTWTPTA